jgi:hypothetical protein
MQKDLLFYSNYCEFCKDVISTLTKHNIREDFRLVCVDDKKYNIPNFIDRVPSILRVPGGEVYMEEHLHEYLELKYKETNKMDEISPMTSQYGNSLYSTNFSSLTGDDATLENKNYLSLGREQHMIHVADDNVSSKKSNDSTIAFEKMMQNRKLDDSYLKQTLNNAGNR